MLVRPPVVTFEVAVPSIVEPDRVNIDFAAAFVAENEAHRDVT